jgi:hypothetical protein
MLEELGHTFTNLITEIEHRWAQIDILGWVTVQMTSTTGAVRRYCQYHSITQGALFLIFLTAPPSPK